MSEGSVWSGLGNNVLGGNRIDELTALVKEIHRELIGSVEALGSRVQSLERQVTDLDAKMNLLIKAVDRLEELPTGQQPLPAEPIDNLLMVMTPKELGIERDPEEMKIIDDGVEVRSVKGLVAPPPEQPEVNVPADEPTLDVPEEVREAHAKWKAKEMTWGQFVKACGGVKKTKAFREILE